MSKYKQFVDELKSIKERKQRAADELAEQKNIIAGLKQDYEAAVIDENVTEADKIQKSIKDAIEKEDEIKSRNEALNNADITELISRSEKLKRLGDEVITENTELLQQQQKKLDEKADELEEWKKVFEQKVAELGEMYRAGERTAKELGEVEKQLYNSNKARGIRLNFSDVKKFGPMFMDNRHLERTFKNVGSEYKIK